MVHLRNVLLSFAIASLALLAGCSSSSTTSGPPPAPSQTRMYISNGLTSGGSTLAFALPITASSTLIGGLVTSNGPFSLCVNASAPTKGALFVIQFSANNTTQPTLLAFAQPIAIAASPSFTLDVGTLPTGCAFDSMGNLYVSREPLASAITVIPGPVSASSVPGTSITSGVSFPGGVAVDGSDDVFVCNQGKAGITEYSKYPTNSLMFTFGSVFATSGCAIGPDGNLYVANGTSYGEIDVYKAPFSNASTVDHSIAPALATNIFDIKFDAAGNMYVAADTTTDSAVYVMAPPYTAVAVKFTPQPGGGDNQVRGLALTN